MKKQTEPTPKIPEYKLVNNTRNILPIQELNTEYTNFACYKYPKS